MKLFSNVHQYLLALLFMSFVLAASALPSDSSLVLRGNNQTRRDVQGAARKRPPKDPLEYNGPNHGYGNLWCKYTAGMIFQWDLETFLEHREREFSLGPLTWDWSSNGCSGVLNAPMGYNFLPACQRHDFGYRNYRAQHRLTDWQRFKLDENFRTE